MRVFFHNDWFVGIPEQKKKEKRAREKQTQSECVIYSLQSLWGDTHCWFRDNFSIAKSNRSTDEQEMNHF